MNTLHYTSIDSDSAVYLYQPAQVRQPLGSSLMRHTKCTRGLSVLISFGLEVPERVTGEELACTGISPIVEDE